jgi:hypothetical protein
LYAFYYFLFCKAPRLAGSDGPELPSIRTDYRTTDYRVPSTEYRVPSTEYRVPSTDNGWSPPKISESSLVFLGAMHIYGQLN